MLSHELANRFRSASWPKAAAAVVVGFIVLGFAIDLASHNEDYQLDLRTYYLAGKAFEAGLNPYDLEALSSVGQASVERPFVYPLWSLPLLGRISSLSFETVYFAFLALKFLLLPVLFILWRRTVLEELGFRFVLFALMVFNAAIYVDLRVGNVSIFEQVMIWAAFYQLLKRRPVAFSVLIVLASSLKLTPLLFLGLLLLEDRSKMLQCGLIAAGLLLMIHGLPLLLGGSLARDYLSALNGLGERGVVNPTVLALLQDGSDWVGGLMGVEIPGIIDIALTGLIGALVLLASWRAIRTMGEEDWSVRARYVLLLACFAYALILPRFKTYSYILIIPSSYSALMNLFPAASGPNAFARLVRDSIMSGVVGLSSLYAISLGSEGLGRSLLGYSPLMVALCAWALQLGGEKFGARLQSTWIRADLRPANDVGGLSHG
ncbi:MAG TPA: glycosyltransferase 87 family protein [Candidatus Tectomicrobia bacterium]